jgi:multidrug resistance efflux pump
MALAQKKLNGCIIRAPFAGQIKDRPVTPGEYLKDSKLEPADPICWLVALVDFYEEVTFGNAL